MARVIGTDFNGLPVNVELDIEKGLIINEIPEESEWSLQTEDENNDGETTEFVGSKKKH